MLGIVGSSQARFALGAELRERLGRADVDVDLGMRGVKAREPRDQPQRGEGRQHADGELLLVAALVTVYLVLGVLASFTFQVIYNITMSAGLAPVKGLTLPLMSYGGSSMIATLAGFGLVLNVRMRRFTN